MNNQVTETDRNVVLDLYAAIATGDLDEVRARLHPEVTLHVPGTHPLAGRHVGPDAVVDFVLGSRQRTDGGERIDLVDVLEGDRHVGVYCTVRAEREGRRPLENPTIHLVRLEGGQVAEIWLHNFDDLSVNDFWS